jgi:hypothetical protein
MHAVQVKRRCQIIWTDSARQFGTKMRKVARDNVHRVLAESAGITKTECNTDLKTISFLKHDSRMHSLARFA